MLTVLALLTSPRTLGNCEIMAKEISRHIGTDHELKLLRLSDYRIKPCRGCYVCLFKDQACPLEDDFYQVVEALAAADGWIVCTPAYFLGPNATLKVLLDRGLALYAHGDRLWRKPAVGIAIAGIPGKQGYTQLGLESFLKLLLADIKALRTIFGALPGEIFLNQSNRDAAVRIGHALFGSAQGAPEPCCPLCGGQTFRFEGDFSVRCMLCSNAGTIHLANKRPVLDIAPGDHDFFFSPEQARTHQKWLVGMKSRFVDQKRRLKQISLRYRYLGTWIKPANRR